MGTMDGTTTTTLTGERSLTELVEALAAAQANFAPVTKTKKARIATSGGGSYEYEYADLADLIAAVKGPLAEHGIWWGQDAQIRYEQVGDQRFGYASVVTWFRKGAAALAFGPLELPVAQATAQGAGSAITYARRYALGAALGIASEADDDGALAGTPAGTTKDRTPKATEPQMRGLHALAKTKGKTHQDLTDWAGMHLGIESLTELTRAGAKAMREALQELPDVSPEKIVAEGGGSPSAAEVDKAILAALWKEATSLIGSRADVLAWYRDEYQVTGAASTKDLTAEHLNHLIALRRELTGEEQRQEAGEPEPGKPGNP